MTKNEKYAAYAAVGGAVVLGGALIYHFSKSSTSSGSGSTSTSPKHIPVNALTATVNNVLGNPVHANIGDTIDVELGPVTFGQYVDQSTANLVLQPHTTPYTMSYKVVGAGDMNSKSILAIGIKGNIGNAPPAQIVAFPVVVP